MIQADNVPKWAIFAAYPEAAMAQLCAFSQLMQPLSELKPMGAQKIRG
jgi:hypothetical protein